MRQKEQKEPGVPFEQRLSKFRVTSDCLHSELLRVSARSTIRLSSDQCSFFAPRWLTPASLGELKQWIGVSQETVDKNPSRFLARRARTLPKQQSEVPQVADGACKGCSKHLQDASQQEREINSAMRQYVLGDASELNFISKILEAKFKPIPLPFWFFRTVVVESGGRLEFGPGSNSLVAHKLVIESGGTIQSEGALSIECSIITRVS